MPGSPPAFPPAPGAAPRPAASPLISPQAAQALAGAVWLDCRFDLADPAAGERAHAEGHPPGAVYVHLDRDLAGAKTGRNGRHPLPDRAAFAAAVGRWGVAPGVPVVLLDDAQAANAARAWWMLRWLGHGAVQVLDGGVAAWRAAGGAWTREPARPVAQPPYPMSAEPAMPAVDADAVLAGLGRLRVLDARSGERFRGEAEPIDPVAGHVPGAHHRFFKDNLLPDGRFKPAAVLRAEFDALALPPAAVVHQCGSGVTACHNLLAMEHAGLGGSALYAGSWSEWSSDPSRPLARA